MTDGFRTSTVLTHPPHCRVALAATGDVGLVVSTLMKMTCGAATLEGQLSVDALLQEVRACLIES